MRANRISALILCAGLGAGLYGCDQPARLHAGADQAPTRIARLCCATINLTGGLVGKHLKIVSVDGKTLDYGTSWADLSPGRHEVRYEYLEGVGARPLPILPYGETPGTLTFEAKQGVDYEIKAAPTDKGVYVWIEDQASHEVVGGTRPADS